MAVATSAIVAFERRWWHSSVGKRVRRGTLTEHVAAGVHASVALADELVVNERARAPRAPAQSGVRCVP
jgi:hypothetical protein